jgi:hypothetical protein
MALLLVIPFFVLPGVPFASDYGNNGRSIQPLTVAIFFMEPNIRTVVSTDHYQVRQVTN